MIALPLFLQMVLEYNALESGLSIAPLSLTMFVIAMLAGAAPGRAAPASSSERASCLLVIGMLALIPIVPRADSGLWLAHPAGRSPAPGSGCSSRS